MRYGAYIIENDGSIHEFKYAGDSDWENEAITTLTEIRCKVIDEFIQRACNILGCSENFDLYMKMVETATQVKEEMRKESDQMSSEGRLLE